MDRILTTDLTKPFLDQLLDHVDREYLAKGVPLERLAFVFGGKRPALFLKRMLAQRVKSAFVPPQFFTIDEFMARTASYEGERSPCGELELSYRLWKLAGRKAKRLLDGRESFAAFLPWGREIVEFISQVDLEAVDSEKLENVREHAEIGFDVPESINTLLKHIRVLRDSFHKELGLEGKTFRGLDYLRAREGARKHDWSEFDQVFFCNFFYFHRTEEDVVRTLNVKGKATLVFQGDQRKWPVLERIAKRFELELKEGTQPTPTTFEVHLHGAGDSQAQAAAAVEVLKSIPDLDRTVVILPEPGMIVPLFSQLHPQMQDLNVSMGYPLKRSSLSFLLDFMARAQLSRKGERYYARDYLRVIQHPFLKNLSSGPDGVAMRVLTHKIEEALTGRLKTAVSGSIYVTLGSLESEEQIFSVAQQLLKGMAVDVDAEKLRGMLKNVHAVAFRSWEGVNSLAAFAGALRAWLDTVVKSGLLRQHPLNLNIAARLYDLADDIASESFSAEEFSFEDIFRIIDDRITNSRVNFSGTPLKGLQVLGLLETRSLNFDYVVVLDANEGQLPKLDVRATIVPREVMLALKLDRLELEEEIQRYQFMRVISSAKHVHLIYQASDEKERSRFVEELVWEKQAAKKTIDDPAVRRYGFTVATQSSVRSVQKTPRMIEMLKNHVFSASSVNTYLNNPYQFYLDQVLGLREEEDLLDEPDARAVGTFIHEVLREAYRPVIEKPYTPDEAFETELLRIFEAKFAERFDRGYASDAFLTKAVMEYRLKRFLGHERERASIVEKILMVEQPKDLRIPLSQGAIRFRCVFDRVDLLKDGGIRLIDYKTGGLSGSKPGSPKMDLELNRESVFKKVKSFQIPLYYYFLTKDYADQRISAELYSLSEMKEEVYPRQTVSTPEEFLAPYLRALDFVITEILDPQIPFIDDAIKIFGD
jgi:hypothetical protein